MHLANLHLSYLSILLFCTIVKPSQLYKDALVAFGNQQGAQYQKHRDKAHEVQTKSWQEHDVLSRHWQKYEDLSLQWQKIRNEWQRANYYKIPGYDRSAYERLEGKYQHAVKDCWRERQCSILEAETKARKAAKDALEMNRLVQSVVRGVLPARKWMEPEQRQKQSEKRKRRKQQEEPERRKQHREPERQEQQEGREGEAYEAKDGTLGNGMYFHIMDIKCLKTKLKLEIGKVRSKLSDTRKG